MDIQPNVLIRCVQLGLKEKVLNSETLWICASCVTCSTRCPNDIDLAHAMDTLRRMSLESGAPRRNTAAFHQAFLDAARTHGRVHELELVLRYKLKTREFFEDAELGKEMFLRGRMRLAPDRIAGRKEVRKILDAPRGDE
jgi:heterodisulfide reductase subunit C